MGIDVMQKAVPALIARAIRSTRTLYEYGILERNMTASGQLPAASCWPNTSTPLVLIHFVTLRDTSIPFVAFT